ncbi:MAG: hypothetical protein JWR52_271 [Marmoricola sp.]|nr:hypothetical protein [Marmoricola sp.]
MPKDHPRGTWLILYSALGIGVLAIVLFAFSAPSKSSALGISLMLAAASFAVFGLLGFLFGVPRRAPDATTSTVGTTYLPNTNLEQVSDWLTKLLLGATLTQLRPLFDWFGVLFNHMGKALGVDAGPAFAGGLTVYFASAGFIGGWLATRMYLVRLMTEADNKDGKLLDVAAAAEQAGNTEIAARIRAAVRPTTAPVAPPP